MMQYVKPGIFYQAMRYRRNQNRKTRSHEFLDNARCIFQGCKAMQRLFRLVLAERPQYVRSEEHTSELQSRENLVCRLLLEKKKTERIAKLLEWQTLVVRKR